MFINSMVRASLQRKPRPVYRGSHCNCPGRRCRHGFAARLCKLPHKPKFPDAAAAVGVLAIRRYLYCVSDPQTHQPVIIAGHEVRFDAQGRLRPWTSWNEALDLEMNFYQQCPADRGYPRFVLATFLDGQWIPMLDRTDTIPATQNGMGILSYLKFYELRGSQDARFLRTACAMGDYLVREALTPALGPYASFTRSTGKRNQFPLAEDCGSQSDRPHEIEPDKGGIAGYALMLLSQAAGERRYFEQALQNAP